MFLLFPFVRPPSVPLQFVPQESFTAKQDLLLSVDFPSPSEHCSPMIPPVHHPAVRAFSISVLFLSSLILISPFCLFFNLQILSWGRPLHPFSISLFPFTLILTSPFRVSFSISLLLLSQPLHSVHQPAMHLPMSLILSESKRLWVEG